MLTCKRCWALLPNATTFCGHCGHAVDASTKLLTARTRYSSDQMTLSRDNVEAGLSDDWYEPLDQSQMLRFLYDANEPTIAYHDEQFSILMPLPSPSYEYPFSPDRAEPDVEPNIHQQLAQDVADFLENIDQQPGFEHDIDQQIGKAYGSYQQVGKAHGLYQSRLVTHTKRNKAARDGHHSLFMSTAVIMVALFTFIAMTILVAYSHPSASNPSKPKLISKKNVVAVSTSTPTPMLASTPNSTNRPIPALISIPAPTPTPIPVFIPAPTPTSIPVFIPTPTPKPTPKPTPTPVRRQLTSTQTQSQTVNATGQGTTAATQATGTLRYCGPSATDTTINQGTTLNNKENTVQVVLDATITGNSTTCGTGLAHVVQAGSIGNILAGDMLQTLSDGSSITNDQPFIGGTDATTYTVVQQSDIDTAATSLETSNQQNASTAIQNQLSPQEHLVGSPQCSSQVSSDHNAGDQAANVTVTVQTTCTATAST
ncbi:MAG TPA: hypothetical protein VN207_09020 [Ktedonobacteraceae bacterium]|nr:hypothetical protein [Ktedonobacteraceae bacterium]